MESAEVETEDVMEVGAIMEVDALEEDGAKTAAEIVALITTTAEITAEWSSNKNAGTSRVNAAIRFKGKFRGKNAPEEVNRFAVRFRAKCLEKIVDASRDKTAAMSLNNNAEISLVNNADKFPGNNADKCLVNVAIMCLKGIARACRSKAAIR